VLFRDRLPPLWTLAGVLIGTICCAAWVFWSARNPSLVSAPAAVCREAYGRAPTARDSAMVDVQIPTEGMGWANINRALSCGALRESGNLR
jgi:hypothetical protein